MESPVGCHRRRTSRRQSPPWASLGKPGVRGREISGFMGYTHWMGLMVIHSQWEFNSENCESGGCGASWPDERWKIARRCGAKHISKSKFTKHPVRTTFGSWDVEKAHAVVARSTFASQYLQNTRCGPLLAVEMSKKCTPLWREAHLQVKMCKTHQVRTTFGSWDVEKVHAVVARSTFPSQNVQNTRGADHFWRFRCRKVHAVVVRSTFRSQNVQNTPCTDHFWRFRCLFAWHPHCGPCQKWAKREGFVAFSTTTTTTLHYTPIHYTTLQLQLHLHYNLLHYTPLHYTALNYIQLHYTTLHYTPLHYTTLPSTTFHSTPLHSTPLHYTTLHYTTLNDTKPQIDR